MKRQTKTGIVLVLAAVLLMLFQASESENSDASDDAATLENMSARTPSRHAEDRSNEIHARTDGDWNSLFNNRKIPASLQDPMSEMYRT